MKTRRLLCFALLVACHGKTAADTQLPPVAPQAAAPVTTKQLAAADAPAALAPASAGGLTWQDALPLVRRTPKTPMRAAEYGVSGDARAELTVFYFGPDQGGSVDANITRWLGQFTQPDGSDSSTKAIRGKRAVGGIAVASVEVTGNYSGAGMAVSGTAAPPAQADAMLLGAIASGPRGPVFFKLTGSQETVERARPGFEQLVSSLHADEK